MSIVNTLLLVILVFFTGTVCPMIGIANGNTLHLVVIALLCLLNADKIYETFSIDRYLRRFLLFLIFMLIVTFVLSKGDLVGVIGWITIPFICALTLSLDNRSLKGMQVILFAFFITECLLAIYERKYNIVLFLSLIHI